MLLNYSPLGSITKLPASPTQAYRRDPARPLAALTLVLAESSPQEHSGAYRGG